MSTEILKKLGVDKVMSDDFIDKMVNYINNKTISRRVVLNFKQLVNPNYKQLGKNHKTFITMSSILTHYFISCYEVGDTPNPVDTDIITTSINEVILGYKEPYETVLAENIKKVLNLVNENKKEV